MGQVYKRNLVVTVGGTDYSADITDGRWTSKTPSGNTLTLAESRAGNVKEWHLEGTIVQSTDSTSMWYKLFAHAGESVVVTLYPHGQTTAGGADATHPGFQATCVVSIADGDFLGGAASADLTERSTVPVDWTSTSGMPTLITS